MAGETPILVPKLTMAATEATFIEWLVEDGVHVDEGQVLYVLETDKVETEIEASASGIVRRGDAESGEVYPVGTQLGIIVNDA